MVRVQQAHFVVGSGEYAALRALYICVNIENEVLATAVALPHGYVVLCVVRKAE